MSVTADRTKKQGEMILEGNTWDILQSNALFCAFPRKKDKPESWDDYYTGFGYMFFFSDDLHMRRTLGLSKNSVGARENVFENAISKITLYRNMWDNAEFAKIVKNFATASGNITIEILAEQPKEDD